MPETQHRTNKRSAGPIIAIIIIVSVVGLFLGWGYFTGKFPLKSRQQEAEPTITQQEKKQFEKKEPSPEKILPEEQNGAVLQPTPEVTPPVSPLENECQKTAGKIIQFFDHLDRQKYIQDYPIKGSTIEHFKSIINKLLANPPVVARETDDLFAILNNMAHFFRVLGPNDILLIKDVLMHEHEIIELTMSNFYRWTELETKCTDTDLDLSLPLAGLYEYAGYFINTLGGQAYLFRRELYLRLLLRYYSVLIIDRANQTDTNRYGIDIRYTLDSLISEIQGNDELLNRQTYLDNLLRLQRKYQAAYGFKQ